VQSKTQPSRARDAHRYLQASQSAGYTGLPAEHREAYEGTMRELERKYTGVRTHALVGTDADFDKPLAAGEREHQRHLREREGLSEKDVRDARKELRGEGAPRKSTAGAVRSGIRGGRAYARARRYARSSGLPGVGGSAGSTVLYAVGVGLGLALLYLAVSKNGSKAITTLLGGAAGFMRALVGPIDPLNPPKSQTQLRAEQQTRLEHGTALQKILAGGAAGEAGAQQSFEAAAKRALRPVGAMR
jgi:hypothetical protein